MSIHDQIRVLVAKGELHPYRPRGRKLARRCLFLTAETWKDINNPNSAMALLGGRGPVEAAMTKWVNGEYIYGRRIGGVLKCGFLCRLDPPPPEIWEIRVTEPLVRWRIFARFASPDTLVATSVRTRTLLGKKGSSNWVAAMNDSVAAWNALFPNHAPFTANQVRDYVTENCDEFEL